MCDVFSPGMMPTFHAETSALTPKTHSFASWETVVLSPGQWIYFSRASPVTAHCHFLWAQHSTRHTHSMCKCVRDGAQGDSVMNDRYELSQGILSGLEMWNHPQQTLAIPARSCLGISWLQSQQSLEIHGWSPRSGLCTLSPIFSHTSASPWSLQGSMLHLSCVWKHRWFKRPFSMLLYF